MSCAVTHYERCTLEAEPGAKLELARGVDGVCNLPERKALLLRSCDARYAWVSVLRRVGEVISRDIEAKIFRFPKIESLVKGDVQVARAPGANLVKISRSGSRNERAGGNGEAVVVEPCRGRMRSTRGRIAGEVSSLTKESLADS